MELLQDSIELLLDVRMSDGAHESTPAARRGGLVLGGRACEGGLGTCIVLCNQLYCNCTDQRDQQHTHLSTCIPVMKAGLYSAGRGITQYSIAGSSFRPFLTHVTRTNRYREIGNEDVHMLFQSVKLLWLIRSCSSMTRLTADSRKAPTGE